MNTDNNKGLEEDNAPSTDSPFVEERIAARRLRIQARLETLKRDAEGLETNLKNAKEPEKELSKSKKQIEQSYQLLSKLVSDGKELVSNVEVACDARETTLRIEEDSANLVRKGKLEQEIEIAAEKFLEITKKWEHAVKTDVPQQLKKILKEQQSKCDKMIEEKNKLIGELQQDLKQKDDQYVKDLKKQAEDVDLVLERMDEQIKTLNRAYGEELDNIENALYSERKDLLELQKTKWSQQSEMRQHKEIEYVEMRQKRVENHLNQLQQIRVQDAEEYNMVKIKLETDVQILEQNLQQMKATYQLNQEKLEYNFQVLKKRDEENTITKSQQKRKITRLQDLLNNLKQKLKNQERQFGDENQTLADDLKRITEQFQELQKKFRHFQATDRKKFSDIWRMNEEQIKDLVTDVLAEDRIIFEQQLGLDWEPPNLEFLRNVGPLQSTKGTSKTAMDKVQEVMSTVQITADEESNSGNESILIEPTASETDLSPNAIKKMLELLCDESGFLVESKLIKLLTPIDKDEQSLMKLDAIFNAIGIETEDDIRALGQYFFKKRMMDLEEEISGNNVNIEQEKDEIVLELIHPNDVIKALRQFIENNQEPGREMNRVDSQSSGIGKIRDSSQDEAYWKQLSSVIAEKKEHLWDAMIEGFEKYSQTLKERAKLIQETDSLKQQNSELRMLLHQYLSSKVNNELQIPPTRVLQLDLPRK